MMTMNEIVDLRIQQQIAHEIYRQQIMQRIPDPFPHMLPIPLPRHVIMPPRISLPGVEVTLQNDQLWKQFHQIGTEMIITKSGRRMFPSMRLSLSGLEDEANYCVLLEMVPIGDCRYKFSGSQWMPAGGAEPQSPQRMYLHPDSPASGAHWQAQPILFNKVKLTNNTLDSNGHIVLASMHKYQPRIHVIRTADLTQIPWAPQQAFLFPETEFVAVTAYQNDRITKLKIDNNPFAKGFRETGQSRSKRKMSSSPSDEDSEQQQQSHQQTGRHHGVRQLQSQPQAHSHSQRGAVSPTMLTFAVTSESGSSICSDKAAQPNSDDIAFVDVDIVADADTDDDGPQIKRLRSNESAGSIASTPLEEMIVNAHVGSECGSNLFVAEETSLQPTLLEWSQLSEQTASIAFANGGHSSFMQHLQQNMQSMLRPSLVDLACTYFGRSQPVYTQHAHLPHVAAEDQNLSIAMPPASEHFPYPSFVDASMTTRANEIPSHSLATDTEDLPQRAIEDNERKTVPTLQSNVTQVVQLESTTSHSPPKRKGFSISAILGGGS
ncbi:T-box transcription factor TBX6L-like [Anastrepha ludens]|uniref:T-box transcription factor TBX6L-like n=1 Tax=Anastrepha ludens TaxID=28586 RepID=UPI0023B1F4BF|nr:T-box transcription factor TBX6L-like [Anastrepha ludens]